MKNLKKKLSFAISIAATLLIQACGESQDVSLATQENLEALDQSSPESGTEPSLASPPELAQPPGPELSPALKANPIVKEIQRMTQGKYVISAKQLNSIEKAKEPQKVADWLEARVTDFRSDIVSALKINIRYVTIYDVLPTMQFEVAIKGYASNDKFNLLKKMSIEKIFEIGQRVGQAKLANHFIKPSSLIYRDLTFAQQQNPIVKEINRLSGGQYKISTIQMMDIERADDPKKVALWLNERVTDFRYEVASALNISMRYVTLADVLPSLDLSRPVRGYSSNAPITFVRWLGKTKVFELGHRVGAN